MRKKKKTLTRKIASSRVFKKFSRLNARYMRSKWAQKSGAAGGWLGKKTREATDKVGLTTKGKVYLR